MVGCGLGDDAEELRRRGFDVTAFDISISAIALAAKRFTGTEVEYVAADLFHPPADWARGFDLVHEAYTLQVLPRGLRCKAMGQLASFIAPGGRMLLIARARDEAEDPGEMPWPVTRSELGTLQRVGLEELSFEDYFDAEKPPVRRFRVTYRRPAIVGRA